MLPPIRVHGRGGFHRAMRLPAPPRRSVIKAASMASILLAVVIAGGYSAISLSIAPATSLYVYVSSNQRETNLVAGLTEEPVTGSQINERASPAHQQTVEDVIGPVPDAPDVANLPPVTTSSVPIGQTQQKSEEQVANIFVETTDQADESDKTLAGSSDVSSEQHRAVANETRGDGGEIPKQQDAMEASEQGFGRVDNTNAGFGAGQPVPMVPVDEQTGNRIAALGDPEPSEESMALEPASDPAAPVEMDENDTPDIGTANEPETSSDCDLEALRAVVERTVIRFRVGSSEVPDRFSSDLRALGELVEDCPDARIEIAGHSDPLGSEGVNFELSWERAEAVATALTDLGFQASPYITVGYGARQPLKKVSLPPVELEQIADASEQTADPELAQRRRRELQELRRQELIRLNAVNRRVQFKIR